jgi:hypothetical protein
MVGTDGRHCEPGSGVRWVKRKRNITLISPFAKASGDRLTCLAKPRRRQAFSPNPEFIEGSREKEICPPRPLAGVMRVHRGFSL